MTTFATKISVLITKDMVNADNKTPAHKIELPNLPCQNCGSAEQR